jgi:hypothetical protein
MAKTCIRTAADRINELIAGKYRVLAPNGKEIAEAIPPQLLPKNHTVVLRLRLTSGDWYVFRLGKRLKQLPVSKSNTNYPSGWIVEQPTVIARYPGGEDQAPRSAASKCTTEIIAAPKIYLPDNYIAEPKLDKKYKRKNYLVDCPVSMDFNGAIGYSCKNIPPPGWQLHSSWGTLPGSNWMEYLLIPLTGEFTIKEGIAGTHHYHFGLPKLYKSICGKPVMDTEIDPKTWGQKSHLREHWCPECQGILEKLKIPLPA